MPRKAGSCLSLVFPGQICVVLLESGHFRGQGDLREDHELGPAPTWVRFSPRGEDELQRWVPASGGLTASGPPVLGRPGGPSKGATHRPGFLRFPNSHPPDRFALWRPGQVIHGALEGSRWALRVVSGSGQRWNSRTQQQQQPPSPPRGGGPHCGSQTRPLLFQITFYIRVKAIYTLGYSVSLISLTTGSIILCLFR